MCHDSLLRKKDEKNLVLRCLCKSLCIKHVAVWLKILKCNWIATICKFSVSGLLTTQLVQVTCSFSEGTSNKNPYARNIASALKPQSNPTAFKVTRGHDSFPILPCCCLCQQAGAARGIMAREPQHRGAGGVCSAHALQSLVGRLVFIHGTVWSNLL